MSTPARTLEIHTSPHISAGHGVDVIMRNVVLALLPVAAFAVYSFGLAALLTLLVATASCVATEHLLCRTGGRASTVGDWSVISRVSYLKIAMPYSTRVPGRRPPFLISYKKPVRLNGKRCTVCSIWALALF